MTLGQRLTKLRKDKNLSQEEVAEKINVTRQTVSKWELDQSLPDVDKLIPLCELYEISTDMLLRGDEQVKDNLKGDTYINDEYVKRKRAKTICVSLFLFVLALIWVVVMDSFNAPDSIIVSGFFIIGTLGVTNIIYNLSILPKVKNDEVVKKKKKNKQIKRIEDIAAISTLIIYLSLSFLTGAWHITWILWIVYALVCEIIHVVFDFKDEEDGDDN
ncbi:MAG: helix-turn-helix domain-containing protein [Bacilli bacterium]|nr:helix-turn-helix domain-containing protein [Bacilli bacterium]